MAAEALNADAEERPFLGPAPRSSGTLDPSQRPSVVAVSQRAPLSHGRDRHGQVSDLVRVFRPEAQIEEDLLKHVRVVRRQGLVRCGQRFGQPGIDSVLGLRRCPRPYSDPRGPRLRVEQIIEARLPDYTREVDDRLPPPGDRAAVGLIDDRDHLDQGRRGLLGRVIKGDCRSHIALERLLILPDSADH